MAPAPAVRRHRGALPAGHEHRRGRRGQLDPARTPTARPPPSGCRRTATTSTTCRSTRAIASTRRSSARSPIFPTSTCELLGRYGRSLYENTDYAILGWGFGVCFLGLSLITDRASNVTQGLPDEWMMMLMTEKETCHEMMDRSVEATIKCLELVNQAVGDYCFAWGIAADDSGTQRGEFIRPELWAEMIKPHYKKLCDWIHAHTSWKIFLHSLRIGLQPAAAFHRGRHRHPQPRADLGRQHGPGAAEEGVRRPPGLLGRRLRHAAASSARPRRRRSGSTSRSAWRSSAPAAATSSTRSTTSRPNVPPENILAMFDAAYEFGAYDGPQTAGPRYGRVN